MAQPDLYFLKQNLPLSYLVTGWEHYEAKIEQGVVGSVHETHQHGRESWGSHKCGTG